MAHVRDPEHARSQQVITGNPGPQPQPQQHPYLDITAKRDSVRSELMLEDQEFIKQIERTQMSHRIEKQRGLSVDSYSCNEIDRQNP